MRPLELVELDATCGGERSRVAGACAQRQVGRPVAQEAQEVEPGLELVVVAVDEHRRVGGEWLGVHTVDEDRGGNDARSCHPSEWTLPQKGPQAALLHGRRECRTIGHRWRRSIGLRGGRCVALDLDNLRSTSCAVGDRGDPARRRRHEEDLGVFAVGEHRIAGAYAISLADEHPPGDPQGARPS